MVEKLRTVERFSLGAFLSTALLRLNDEHRTLAQVIAQSAQAQAGQVLQKHLAQLFANVRDSNMQSWPLLAEEFVNDLKPPIANRREFL